MQNRRKSRKLALKILFGTGFQKSVKKSDAHALIQKSPDLYRQDKSSIEFALEVVNGVHKHQEEIEKQIAQNSLNWKIERISTVDLNIMKIAVFEILHKPDIPKKVSINEAIELSKIFGEKESSAFINGILNQIEKT